MDLRIEAFRNIRPGAIRLVPPAKRSGPPVSVENANPLGLVLNFARFVGLDSIPAATVEKFRSDPDYRYCFYRLKGAGKSFYTDPCDLPVRERLKTILLDPAAANDRDYYLGVRVYLNNFTGHLPGGAYRVQYGNRLSEFPSFVSFFRAVDSTLGEGGLRSARFFCERAEQERTDDQNNFAARAAYYRFCLQLFKALVDSKQFTPEQLWA